MDSDKPDYSFKDVYEDCAVWSCPSEGGNPDEDGWVEMELVEDCAELGKVCAAYSDIDGTTAECQDP